MGVKPKIGAQLYTVREYTQTEHDFSETIKKIADIGYKSVQLSAIGEIRPESVRNICDSHNITIDLTHMSFDRLLNDTDNVIAEHEVYNCHYIGLGSMPGQYRAQEGVRKFIEDMTIPVQKIKQSGRMFMYHNHAFEFIKYDGKYILDLFAEGFPEGTLGFVIDTFWVQYAGADPAFWIEKYAGKVDTIHFKDMNFENDLHKMSPILEGNMNFDHIFDACETAGVKYAFVEQDDCYGEDPFDCLRRSYDNLHKLGFN